MDFLYAISVVMPTYNTDLPMLKEAVESILSQTFKDFEFIIIDDCSTNGCWDYLNGLEDSRIKLIRNQTNLGVTKSLNIGLREAKGKYIARMDADDISLPQRFEKQFEYMERHPDVIMCGTNAQTFDSNEESIITKVKDTDYYNIKALFYNWKPLHPTIFLNNERIKENSISYDEELIYSQDCGLYSKIGRYGKVAVVQEPLFLWRRHESQITTKHALIQRKCLKIIQRKLLQELIGDVSEEEIENHLHFCCDKSMTSNRDVWACFLWYRKLITENNKKGIYNKKKFIIYSCREFCITCCQTFIPHIIKVLSKTKNK